MRTMEPVEIAVDKILPSYAQVAQQLRKLILGGQLLPGRRLPSEAELATQFGVSRSTVREAVRSLAADKLLVSKRGVTGGTFIAFPETSDLEDYLQVNLTLLGGYDQLRVSEIAEVRATLEGEAAALAAQRRNETHLAQMHALENASDDEGDDPFYSKHAEFHTIVLDASDNRLLQLLTRPIFGVVRRRFRPDEADRGFWHEVAGEHTHILAAIEHGDSAEARRLMVSHIERLNFLYAEGKGDMPGQATAPELAGDETPARVPGPVRPRGSRAAKKSTD